MINKQYIGADAASSIVVALVALPLCLGIALASGAPPIAGLISGIVGGIVVSLFSRSELSVSGPAAGLLVLVLAAINDLGYDAFLTAVCLAGALQLVLGFLRAGVFAYYFPSSVIRGMLAAIGAILILKQIPHAVGFDSDYEGDLAFFQPDGLNTISALGNALEAMHAGAAIIAAVSLFILLVVPRVPGLKDFKLMPAPLLAVIVGTALNELFVIYAPSFINEGELLVPMPVFDNITELTSQLGSPVLSALADAKVWIHAGTIAAVASLETLLCVEAIDKLDPLGRTSPPNRELKAQGIGNFLAGLLGGIPVTAVIIRGSTNVHAGGRTRLSAILHGLWLLLAVAFIPSLLARIPLSSLAAVLLVIGYRLTPITLHRSMLKQEKNVWIPFLITFFAIIFTDLLKGVTIGLVAGVFFILYANSRNTAYIHHRDETLENGRRHIRIELAENVSFLNKANLDTMLSELPDGIEVEIDGSTANYIDHDAAEILNEFEATAKHRDILVTLKNIPRFDVVGGH